jgi:hypothetical protein
VRLWGSLVVTCAVIGAIEAGGHRPVPNASLMASVARYVENERRLGAIIGDEEYTQHVFNLTGCPAVVSSEFALVRLPHG